MYKNLLFLVAILFALHPTTNAQTTPTDSVEIDNNVESGFFTENLDTLAFQGIESISEDSLKEAALVALKNIPDSVYIERLQQIQSPINFPYNSKVKAYIELYTKKKRNQVSIMLGLADYYFPIFEEQLDAANLPLELKYLPIIESALNPRAFSRAGASGLWQFMYGTGKQYGLVVNSYIDERRDPIKSTAAAVKFLKDLYNIYGDWYLVIAAYNCGPGNVNKAIRRSGGKKDFWQIYYRLPRETRGYVPAFIAAAYTMNYYQEHLIEPVPANIAMNTDTIMVSDLLHFKQIEALTGVNVKTLQQLNPQYRLDVVPSTRNAYALTLPEEKIDTFLVNEEFIFAYERETFFANNQLAEPTQSSYTPSTPNGKAKLYYTVKSGDAVGLIADWYDVYSSDLRYWNNIRRNLIKVGQKLTIYVPQNKVEYYSQINKLSSAQKKRLDGKTIILASSKSSSKSQNNYSSGDFEYYTVQKGDNLWTIAKKYPGVSNADIMQWNNITDATKINPGQRLKIKPKG